MYLEKMFGLKNKVAIVTGGSQGIGQVVACGLAKAGAKVVIISRTRGNETVDMIVNEGGSAYWIPTDVTIEESVESAFAEIFKRSGSIDIVFNNVGICLHDSSLEVKIADFRKILDINITGEFIVARAAGKIMVEHGIHGSIINTSSMSGSIVNIPQWQCSYNASKAAVIHMTRSLAVEWVDYHIRVNCLSPGYIETENSVNIPQILKDKWNSLIPIHRTAKPEELIPAVLYLACDASSYTTGSEVVVDGAYTCI